QVVLEEPVGGIQVALAVPAHQAHRRQVVGRVLKVVGALEVSQLLIVGKRLVQVGPEEISGGQLVERIVGQRALGKASPELEHVGDQLLAAQRHAPAVEGLGGDRSAA